MNPNPPETQAAEAAEPFVEVVAAMIVDQVFAKAPTHCARRPAKVKQLATAGRSTIRKAS